MQRLVHKYSNLNELQEFIQLYLLKDLSNCFVRVFTSSLQENEAIEITRTISNLLPTVKVFGSTCPDSVIYNSEQVKDATIVIFDSYEDLHVKLKIYSLEDKSPQYLAEEIFTDFGANKLTAKALVHTLFSGGFQDVQPFLERINELAPILKLAGGIVGDNHLGGEGYFFTKDGKYDNSAVVFAVYGEHEQSFNHSFNSFEILSDEYTITKTNGEFIEEIENIPALDWMCEYLSLDKAKFTNSKEFEELINYDFLMNFPLIIDDEASCGLFTKYLTNSHSLSLYHSTLPANQKFRVGYVNPEKTVRDMHELCSLVLEEPIEEMFIYSCLARKVNLQNFSEWELAPFKKYKVSGIFLFGEISHKNGQNYFNNGTSIFTGISENKSYIIPDVLALEESHIPKNEKDFAQKATQKQKEYLLSNGEKLFHQLSKVSHHEEENKYIDKHFLLPNLYQYEADRKKYNFEKICLIEVCTADAAIAFAGEELYIKSCIEVLGEGKTIFDKVMEHHTYSINYKTFVFAPTQQISDEEFLKFTKELHNQFEFASSPGTGLSGVLRFVVVLGQKDLLATGTKYLFLEKNQQENYIVCSEEHAKEEVSNAELEAISLLKRAVDTNGIVPFYQGIYDNDVREINKYEALMRVIDAEGKMYTPFFFLDYAKKYRFYKKISRMMVERVLEDFRNRTDSVSINISVYDLESSNFRRWFLEKLQNYPSPERIIIEFVETESYDSLDLLVEFLEQIRKTGAKVAVDDFGAGYSTFSAILAIKPDFLKVDGSIIRNIISNDDNKIILDTIQYLAKKMKTKIVAEFVENKDIQNYLEYMGVNYSQGYYFAKPEPLENLNK